MLNRPPRLIHPVLISLVKVDYTKQPPRDPQFGELVDKVQYTDPFIVTAQLGLGKTDQYYQQPFGDRPKADGHVTFSIPQWISEAPAGLMPQVGDHIVQLYPDREDLTMEVDWVFSHVEPRGHYPGRPWFWFAFYTDMRTQRAAP